MRTILKLIEPGHLRWSSHYGNWMARVPGTRLWLDLYRQTDPHDPPDYLVREAEDVDTEVVDRRSNEPVRIVVRDRRAEWRQRMGEGNG